MKIGIPGGTQALWLAEFAQAELRRIGMESDLAVFKTPEDQAANPDIFTREIEAALQRGEIQTALYPMEMLSTIQAEGLVITAVSQRDNPADLLLIRPEAVDPKGIFKLKAGAVVGTAAPRRAAQMRFFRPDTDIRSLDGAVTSRLERLRKGDLDAIFTDAAGLRRLDLDVSDLMVLELNPREFIPAPAQGVLAWQAHRDDLPTRRILKQVHHPEVSALTNVERRVLQLLGGSPDLPLGVFATCDPAGNYHAFAACEIEGQLRQVRLSQSTSFGMAEKLAERLREG